MACGAERVSGNLCLSFLNLWTPFLRYAPEGLTDISLRLPINSHPCRRVAAIRVIRGKKPSREAVYERVKGDVA